MPKRRKSFQPQGNKTPTTDVQPELAHNLSAVPPSQPVFFEVEIPGERISSGFFLPTITESKDAEMSENRLVIPRKEDARDVDEEVIK